MRNTAVAKSRYSPFIPNMGFTTQTASIPASTGGWDTFSSLAEMKEDHAVQMDNWIPRTGYLEIRRGSSEHATGIGDAVESLMAYNNKNGTNKLFAGGNDKIWDVTSAGAASDTGLTSITNNRWQYTNFVNASANNYLIIGNGVDDARIYDGTNWATFNPTISGYTSSDIIQPHGHQGRVWMVLEGTTDVAYLPLGAISGTATIFPLGSIFTDGGYIMAMASWTVDTRQTVSDYAAFISSRGQVAVYMGNDPATNWALVGVYDLAPPIGRRCFYSLAGDVLLINLDGLQSLTQALNVDRAAAENASLTKWIDGAYNIASYNYNTNFGWQLTSYPKGNLAILNIPQIEGETQIQFAMNTITGAWCRFLGINANCWEILSTSNTIYYGGNDGTVYQWDVGSSDNGTAITAVVQTAFNYQNQRGRLKNWTMIRPIITSDGAVVPGVGLNVDFGTGAMVSIPSPVQSVGATWDVSLWDEAVWPLEGLTTSNWQSISGTGQCASVITAVQTTDNGAADGVLLRLNGWGMSYEMGGLL